ncbi:hypothetical protein CHUAL_004729 [Chamberlinius hualienensis]
MSNVEVIVGTYEEILIGYRVVREKSKYVLEQSFTNHSHCGSIRCLAASGRHLASGGTDETVKLFNMSSRTEVGALIQQEGTITSLQFFNNSHLFSSSEDGSICIWKPGSWQCLKTLKGHKSGVTDFSVHPSGKLAISASKDRTLKTWNLIKGKAAFTTNIKSAADIVQWSPDGKVYAVVVNNFVHVYSVQTAGIVHSIDFGRRVNALIFVKDRVLAIGGEGENVEFHSAEKKAIHCVLPTKTTRIKALSCVLAPVKKINHWLVTSSSEGVIKIWEFDLNNLNKVPELIMQADTGCRITCQVVTITRSNEDGNDSPETVAHTSSSDQEYENSDEKKRKETQSDQTNAKKLKKE